MSMGNQGYNTSSALTTIAGYSQNPIAANTTSRFKPYALSDLFDEQYGLL